MTNIVDFASAKARIKSAQFLTEQPEFSPLDELQDQFAFIATALDEIATRGQMNDEVVADLEKLARHARECQRLPYDLFERQEFT